MAQVLAWCRQNKIACLYFLGDIADPETVRTTRVNGFDLVDVRLVFEHRGNPSSAGKEPRTADEVTIRPSEVRDIGALREIARTNHRDSRFYFDRHFAREDCDRLFETWIERSCSGYADAVFVAEMRSAVAGYVSCHVLPDATGNIGLVGVSENAQRRQIGRRLVQRALEWFAGRGIETTTVVTQARNVAAQRLYQRCGFVTQSAGLFYHRWFDE